MYTVACCAARLCRFCCAQAANVTSSYCLTTTCNSSMSTLAGKRVAIFGGSSGMGKAAAKVICKVGGSVFIIGRDSSKLEAAKKEIVADAAVDQSSITTRAADLTSEASVKDFFESYEPGFFNHMVITAGATNDANTILGAEGLAKLREQFDFKFFAQLTAVAYGAERLADGGSIVLTTGALAKRPGKGGAALGVCNAALDSIVKGLANDLGPRLRINSVSPGLVDTEIWAHIPAEARAGMLAGFGRNVPAGRAGKPEDIGHAILFLLENSFITGTVLDVDGGASVRP